MRAVLWLALGAGCTSDPVEILDLSWFPDGEADAVAWVQWEQLGRGSVGLEVQVDDGVWLPGPEQVYRRGEHQQRVVGIPYGMEAQVRLVTEEGSFPLAVPVVASVPPDGLPEGEVVQASPDDWYGEGRYLLTSISEGGGGWGTDSPFWTMIVDRQGRAVWARRTRFNDQRTLYATVARSGDHLIVDEFDWLNTTDAEAIRMHLDAEIERIDMSGHHHAFVELPDGSLVWGSTAHGGGEALVQRSPGRDDVEVLWTCRDNWPENQGSCRSNAVYYDDDRDSFLYSFYTNNSVVEIDRASGSTLWWAGWMDTVPGGYRFVPSASQFRWQHGVTWTPQGTLLLQSHTAERNHTEGREYEVDRSAGTLELVWEYDGLRHADTNGDVWRLPNGNTLNTLGSASLIQEMDAEGAVVWHLDYGTDNRLLGRSEFIADLYPLLSPL